MNLLQRLTLLAVIGVVLAVAINHYTKPASDTPADTSASAAQ